MKLTLLIIACAILVAGPALAVVAGTAHDLRTDIGVNEICVACHTPHGASPAVPLWNHNLPTPANTYTVYASGGTIDATDLADFLSSNGSVSSLCLSCHDGSVALGSLVNDPDPAPTDTTTTISGAADLGLDLSNDHPINFTFGAALITADGELQAPTNAILFGPGSDQMECGSCHDPHDNTDQPFLVSTNAASALCLDCHVK